MSERIQVVVPKKMAREVEAVRLDEGHENTSEFVRYVLQDYIIRKQHGLVKEISEGKRTKRKTEPQNSSENASRIFKEMGTGGTIIRQ